MENKLLQTKGLSKNFNSIDDDFCLTDSDFYPPYDDRILESYIEDIEDSDSFEEYARYIFDLYEEEGYYEN